MSNPNIPHKNDGDLFFATEVNEMVASIDTKYDGDVVPIPLATSSNRGAITATVVNVKDYGAVGDGVTDDTTHIQNALNALIALDGGTLFFPQPAINYLINGTIYSNPPAGTDGHCYTPILFQGPENTIKDDLTQTHGSFLYKPNLGDIIRVNIDTDGSPWLDPNSGMFCFGVSGLGFVGAGDGNQTAIRMYRTRSHIENIYGTKLNGLIYQDINPPGGYVGTWDNYCDQSVYSNIRMFLMCQNGCVFSLADACIFDAIYYEYPGTLATTGITITGGSGMRLSQILHANGNQVMATNVGNFISMSDCDGFQISGVYGERFFFGSVFNMLRCQNFNITGYTERFSSYNLLTVQQCSNWIFTNVYSWANKVAGFSDIKYIGTSNGNNSWQNFKLLSYPDFNVRSAIVCNSDGSLSNMNVPAFSTQTGTDSIFYYWMNTGNGFFEMGNIFNGAGVAIPIRIGVSPTMGIPLSNASSRTHVISATSPFFLWATQTSGVANVHMVAPTFTGSAVEQVVSVIAPTINQSGSASYRGLWITPFEQSVGSGSKLLIDAGTNTAAQAGGTYTSLFQLDDTGEIRIPLLNTAPSTASSTGAKGEIRFTTTGIYICTATNTWMKATIATF